MLHIKIKGMKRTKYARNILLLHIHTFDNWVEFKVKIVFLLLKTVMLHSNEQGGWSYIPWVGWERFSLIR